MTTSGLTRPLRRSWPTWAPYAAALWSLTYAAAGVFWALGGPGYPFGPLGDPDGQGTSLLADLDPTAGSWGLAVLGVLGAALALGMARARPGAAALRWPVAIAVAFAAGLALLVPDYRLLALVGYTPIVVVGAPFGYPPDVSLGDVYAWPMINQILCTAGGLLWALTALAYHRRTGVGSGRPARWATPAAAARWGRWAVAVAVVIPVGYAVTRIAWALGIPLGVSRTLLDDLGSAVWAGAALGAMALGGAVLTLGLVARWGEVFPRWLPVLAGRRVPPPLAVVPACIVALIVTSAGLMFIRMWLTGTLPDELSENPAALVPELFWPLWGAALAAAAAAYWLRRRPARDSARDDILSDLRRTSQIS